MDDEAFIFYSGLLALQPRSAVALEAVLADYFDVPVEVEQFVGAWRSLGDPDQCVFGAEVPESTSSASARWWATRSGTSSRACGSSSDR